MIEAKVAGQKVVATPETHVAPVIDIMEALKKSLAEKRKPVATAVAGSAPEEAVEEAAPKKRARKTS
jgi:non-homologous end joining protein Ku